MRIELASGDRPHDGHLHCDERILPATDLACRVEVLPFATDSVESILAYHIIEHFPFESIIPVLAEWRRVLKPGGEIMVVTPNLGYITQGYMDGWMDYTEARNRIFGGQDYEGNFHYTVFDSPALSHDMREAGFRRVMDVTTAYESRKIPMSLYFTAGK